MDDWQTTRLTDAELKEFFDRLFPHGFSGTDVLAEIAPEGWEKSPLVACFHPSPEQALKESLQFHRNMEELTAKRRNRKPQNPRFAPEPEPTMETILEDW